MKIYFATWLTDKTLGKTLSAYDADNRLVSYHFLQEQNVDRKQLEHYIEHGDNLEKE